MSEADSGEDSQYFFLHPLEEVHLGAGVRVRSLLWPAEGRWLVSDEAGSLVQASICPQQLQISHALIVCWSFVGGIQASIPFRQSYQC